jgi:hypothetical protein
MKLVRMMRASRAFELLEAEMSIPYAWLAIAKVRESVISQGRRIDRAFAPCSLRIY